MRVTGSFSLGTEGKLRYRGHKSWSWETPKYTLVLRRVSSLGKVMGEAEDLAHSRLLSWY